MKYEVRCTCGKAHAVTGADAGETLRCGCGRTVEVPPLHELRTAVGEEVLSPVVRIQALLLEGKLPGTRDCACCHRDTTNLVRLSVVCEQIMLTTKMTGCNLLGGFLFLGLIPALLVSNATRSTPHGDHVAVTVPLPVCEVCRPRLHDHLELRRALRHIPEYAALLDRYPKAQITIVG